MLDGASRGQQSEVVKDSADDPRQRGWAILERLRALQVTLPPAEQRPSEEAPPDQTRAEAPQMEGDQAATTGKLDAATAVKDQAATAVAKGARHWTGVDTASGSSENLEASYERPPPDPSKYTEALPPPRSTAGMATATPVEGLGTGTGSPAEADVDAPAASPGSDKLAVGTERKPVNSFARALPRVIAVANQKGGVGKTTTAVNVGAAMAELGYRVLVVDLDPQGNATTGLGVNLRNLDSSVYDVIMRDTPLEDCIEPTSLRNLFVAPATINLAGAEIELVPAFSRELKLRRAVEGVVDDFDYVMIDCPPSLGLLTVNGLGAASEVLVPIQCEYYALEGLGQLLRNVSLVQGHINPRLEVTIIVLTMYDARTKLAEQVAGEVRGHFGAKVCRNIVPRTVRLSEAPSFGQPIVVFDPTSRGAIAYREIAKEVSGGAPQRTG
ncbi:MAG TPA: AAA family ATPase [Acidimicrobiales bacterium]|nr:AAA family ATPase [Acidimicrobiales bacterium]